MTERKPPGLSWQSWVDRQIREGQVDGAFDDLHGHGEPIADIGLVHDELWWVRAKLREEDLEYLPPTIAIRAERADALDAAMAAATEREALVIVDDVNARIRYINSHGAGGPPSTTVVIDTEAFLERWHEAHPGASEAAHHSDETEAPVDAGRSWWRRLVASMRSPFKRGRA